MPNCHALHEQTIKGVSIRSPAGIDNRGFTACVQHVTAMACQVLLGKTKARKHVNLFSIALLTPLSLLVSIFIVARFDSGSYQVEYSAVTVTLDSLIFLFCFRVIAMLSDLPCLHKCARIRDYAKRDCGITWRGGWYGLLYQ